MNWDSPSARRQFERYVAIRKLPPGQEGTGGKIWWVKDKLDNKEVAGPFDESGADRKADELNKKWWADGKSLSNTGTKAMDPDTNMVDDVVDMKDEPSTEPWGSQVLRRVHEDHKHLMKDYDQMLEPLEHTEVKNHMMKHLQTMGKFLDDTEKLHTKHYKDLPPLDDSMEDEAVEEEETPDGEEVVEADSEEEELPSPEEAVAGMTNKQLKMLRKALEDEEDKRIKAFEEDDEKKCKGMDDDEKEEKDFPEIDKQDEAAEVTEPMEKCMKALEPHEMSKVGEAAQYAKSLASEQNYGEEHRQKSFHYHKALDEIAHPMKDFAPMDKQDAAANVIEPGEMGEKSDPAQDQSKLGGADLGIEGQDKPGFEEYQKNLHPHRKACKDASDAFAQLAQEKAFGEQHREMAAELGKSLDAVAQSTQGTEDLGIEGEHKPGFEEYDKSMEDDDETEEKRLRYRQKAKEQLVIEDGKEIGEKPGTYWLVNQRGTAVDGPFNSRAEAERALAKQNKAFPEMDKQDDAEEIPEKKRFRLKKDIDEDEKRLKGRTKSVNSIDALNALIHEMGIKATHARMQGSKIIIDWNGEVEEFRDFASAEREVRSVANKSLRRKAMEDEEEKRLRRRKALDDEKEEKDMDDEEEEKSIVNRNRQKSLPPAKVKAYERIAAAQKSQIEKLDETLKTLLVSRS